jgi:hypothetical protein
MLRLLEAAFVVLAVAGAQAQPHVRVAGGAGGAARHSACLFRLAAARQRGRRAGAVLRRKRGGGVPFAHERVVHISQRNGARARLGGRLCAPRGGRLCGPRGGASDPAPRLRPLSLANDVAFIKLRRP